MKIAALVSGVSTGCDVAIGRVAWHSPRTPGVSDRSAGYRSRCRRATIAGMPDTEDVAALAELLTETAEQHHAFEARAPKHNWADWYAAYMTARFEEHSPEDASQEADQYMADEKNIVVA